MVFKQHHKFQKHDFAFEQRRFWLVLHLSDQSKFKQNGGNHVKTCQKKLSRPNGSAIFNEVLAKAHYDS